MPGAKAADSWTYGYDDLGRLISAANAGSTALTETYAYSDNGNLTFRTRMGAYSYPAGTALRPHAVSAVAGQTMSYDANGNMVSDGTRTLGWDAANRLSFVTQNGVTVTFAYGPNGARVKKSDGFKVTLYPDAGVEIDRSNPSSAVITRYPHADLKVVSNDSGSAIDWSYLHRDHLASVRIVTDSAGVVAEETGYAAFGERGTEVMSTNKGYIGERFDPETGLLYLNARYYDPKIARFILADPQGEDRGPAQGPGQGQSKVQSAVQIEDQE